MKYQTGEKFGRLTLIEITRRQVIKFPDGRVKGSRHFWLCQCECGNTKEIEQSRVVGGGTQSCGCLQKERASQASTQHGHHKGGASPTYMSWQSMKKRCENPKNKEYPRYGGRGISICARWKESFENFLKDMGEKPVGSTLDRINTNGNYEPGNCRWTTAKQQANNRRSNRLITWKGSTRTLAEWASELGVHYSVLQYRLDRANWPIDKALTTPVRQCKKG